MIKDTQGQTATVQVALRIRPLTERDRAQPRFANSSNSDVLRAQENHVQIVSQNKYFTYDHVFAPETQQGDIFAQLGQKPVQKFVEGYNVTMLAYGQTSSGKTYTMGTAQHTDATDPEEDGIVPRAMALLFDILQQQQHIELPQSSPVSSINGKSNLRPLSQVLHSNQQQQQKSVYRYSVKVSFVEIYNEELIDLLNSAHPSEKPPVTIREDTKGHIYWTGVKEVVVHNTDDVLYFLQQGTENRATGSTDMNEKSSRSHAIFSVTLKQERWVPTSPQPSRAASPILTKLQQAKQQQRLSVTGRPASNSISEDGDWIITSSKFHFVDLAGSERLKRTAAEGDRRKEGININAGLLALGNVISALGDPSKKSTHVPYRDSKLTRLLQDSLGGSAMTLMIACVSPAESNLSETLNTLQYANRARNIKNKMEKNEMEEWMTTDNLDVLRSTITKLKNELRNVKSTPTSNSIASNKLQQHSEFDDFSSTGSPIANPDFDDLYHQQHVMIADLQQQIEELQGTADFIKERNMVVEKELVRLHQERPNPADQSFQHLVEPVIEEYEKSISGLESQLALIRAALSHSDQGFEEQQLKIEQLEIVLESQEKTINELRRRVGKLLERRLKDETYITELEKKLMAAVEETVHDREMLSELRGKILKLKEVDESTEQYIHDLEGRLTASETERTELKEKLSKLLISTKEETAENEEEKAIVDQGYQKEIQELKEKHEASENERQKLQNQVEQLSLANNENEAKDISIATRNFTASEEIFAKDQRIAELESSFANLQQDHQDTLKELDEVLVRYQEALENADSNDQQNNNNQDNQQEVQLLRESIQHLEHELDMSTRREIIFRQMSEEHNESAQVERSLQNLEISNDNALSVDVSTSNETSAQKQINNEFVLETFDALQKKYQHIKTELQLQNIRVQDEDDLSEETMLDIHTKYETQILQYKRELKNLTRVLKEIKKIKATELKSSHPGAAANPEHKILMKSIQSLDKQLTEHYDKIRSEAKRFSNDVLDMISHNNGLKSELSALKSRESDPANSYDNFSSPNQLERNTNSGVHSNNSSLPSSPRTRSSLIRPPTNFNAGNHSNKSSIVNIGSNNSIDDSISFHSNTNDLPPSPSSADLISQYEKNRYALSTRLSIAKQDLRAHQTVISALEHKLKTTEIAINTCNKRIDGIDPVTDREIEELMSKMDAMKIQLESTEKLERKSVLDQQ
ncbi:P-loop containing nucleoside triphosphate hydrolase protein [Parasitella parasitica]|nr:P-loop containing nucleoside triphosphate hydrolase protein [Parasitella parasitica]